MPRPRWLSPITPALLAAGCVLWDPALSPAFDVYGIGGQDGNPWGAPISFQPGTLPNSGR